MAKTPRARMRSRSGGGAGLAFVPGITTVTLDTNTIAEGAAEGTLVGTFTVTPSVATLTLTDNAGGRFKIVGNTLVAGPVPTVFAVADSHDISVRSERGIVINDAVLTIVVTDVI